MNAQQVATAVGVTERTVRRWVERGQLPAERVGREFVIDLDEARKLAAPRAANELAELVELRDLKAAYAELERRYEQLLEVLSNGR